MFFTCSFQASFELPRVVKFDPHPPRINLDTKRVMATQSFAATLQESLMTLFTQPFEARVPLLKPGKYAGTLKLEMSHLPS